MSALPSAEFVDAAATERLGRPGLEPLVAELGRRFGADNSPPVRVRLIGLTDGQRSALADLFGEARLPASPASVRVDRLCARLGLDGPAALRRCVQRLHGPLGDRAAERQVVEQAKLDLWTWFEQRCGGIEITGLGPLRRWPEAVRRDGVRGTIAQHWKLLDDALRTIEALPGNGSTPLAVFATTVVNDPHGLDRKRRLARLVTTAIADAAGRPAPTGAEQTREIWQLVGIEPDPLSSIVLVLGLRIPEPHPLAPFLDQQADVSEPVPLTLSQLLRWSLPALDPTSAVYVVENPSLLADAARGGWSGPPLVCSSGRPSMAVVHLLRQLGARAALVRQHADFDAAGLGICAWLADQAGTTPWRMSVRDYRSLVQDEEGRIEITGTVPDTPWDPALAEEVRRTRRAAFEEEVSAQLLDAMRAKPPVAQRALGSSR